MVEGIAGLLVLVVAGIVVTLRWRRARRAHERRLRQLPVRVHVNGTRGKSSVTRLVAGVLREASCTALAKTTGSSARVIFPSGEETPIYRRGAPTINEQVDVVSEYVDEDMDAIVFECMAVDPLYQRYSEQYMVQSTLGVITNVREDHQDEMGDTLEEIARSLSETIPPGGTLIVSETKPDLRGILREQAEARDCRFIYADPEEVRAQDVEGFGYLQFAETVAVGLAVARHLRLPHETALRGMRNAVPDIGAVRLSEARIRDKDVLWVPLFAANDRQSLAANFEALQARFPGDATVIGVLNNRSDRGRRAERFAHVVPDYFGLYLDHVVTLGDFERPVTRSLVERGIPRDHITNLGHATNPTFGEMLDTIAGLIEGRRGVLVGMVNIHTDQAELLTGYFEENVDEFGVEQSHDPTRLPAPLQSVRYAQARHEARKNRKAVPPPPKDDDMEGRSHA
jgi:poly-gamma-glutamate synthase PgsB/CapB